MLFVPAHKHYADGINMVQYTQWLCPRYRVATNLPNNKFSSKQSEKQTMDQHIPFINHESEMRYIDSIIQDWGSRRVITIDGAPGSGKSYLLKAIYENYSNNRSKTIPIVITPVICFEDPAHHMLQHVGCHIARCIGEKIFEPYLRVLMNWRKMQLAGSSMEQLSQAAIAVNQTFVDCFKMVSARIVLLFDAVDLLHDRDMQHQLIETSKQLENVTIIVAGYSIKHITDALKKRFGKDVQNIVLQALHRRAAEEYIHRKQTMLRLSLPATIMPHIIALSNGQPILLDLATECYACNHIPPWMQETSAETLQYGSDEQHAPYQQLFATDLAAYIMHTTTEESTLAMLLSHVSLLDDDMIHVLLGMPLEGAHELRRKMVRRVYIKQLPGERICLYEPIRRIIQAYVTQHHDPDGTRRQRNSQQIADYLKERIIRTQQRIEQIEATLTVETDIQETRYDARERRHDDYMHVACEQYQEHLALSHELQVFSEQRLVHTLIANRETGIATFIDMFEQATQHYDLSLRSRLLAIVQQQRTAIAEQHANDIDMRQIVCLYDQSKYSEAKELADTLLAQTTLTPHQHVLLQIHKGHIEAKLGCTDQSIYCFEQAMIIATNHHLQLMSAIAKHARGEAYCLQGRYDLAMNDYLESYQICLAASDMPHVAAILQSISYIHALRGNRQSAMESCHAALDLCYEIDTPHGIAVGHTMMGEIYSRFNQPSDALSHYNRAFDVFSRQHDIEWMSIVRCGRAFAYQIQQEVARAESEQEWVLMHGSITLKPRILHSQFLSYFAHDDIEHARTCLEESRAISQKIGDSFNDYKSFADLVELAWFSGEFHRWHEFSQEHSIRYAMREGVDALRLRGSCLRKIGDLAICAGNYDDALEAYQYGLPLIAQFEIHERYTIRSQLRQTDRRLRDHVPDTVMHRLGHDLAAFWQSHPELVSHYPEVLLMFHRW